MLYTVIKKNSYQDSINLMLLTNAINLLEGVTKCSVMMGTEANKDILRNSNLLTPEAEAAAPNDMVIAVETTDEKIVEVVVEEASRFLNDLSVKRKSTEAKSVSSLDAALQEMPEANVALFSIPGEYAADEIEKALDKGLHVFSFTDNVAVEDEVRLKKKAHEKGLLLMGPDCGTGMIGGIPLAFTNVLRGGNIGIVGASGTGLQEVTTIIDRLGGGVIHAIGTGGHDLSEAVNAITVRDALVGLEKHEATDVIVLITKPPAKRVRDEVVDLLRTLTKPVVALFLGEKPDHHEKNLYFAHTLEETAMIAVDLAAGREVKSNYSGAALPEIKTSLGTEKTVKGLYSGGTLASEAAMLIAEALKLENLGKGAGYTLSAGGHVVMDLGDDVFTQGKPHPMIDPETRINKIREFAKDENTGVILLDCVLGYGSHPDMAGALSEAISEARESAKKAGRELYFVSTVCGTQSDPQNYQASINTLKSCGVLVADSNAGAVRLALRLKGLEVKEGDKPMRPAQAAANPLPEISEGVIELLNNKPRIINIGLSGFTQSVTAHGGRVVQYDWKPAAGGNKKMIRLLNILSRMEEIDRSNEAVIEKMRSAQPFLVDVVPAKSVIEVLNGKVLLHAGPPIEYRDMTGPMQGSCVGAVLFEAWAGNEADARRMLENGEIKFTPCHHVGAVGPMGGITSGNMPVLVVTNRLDETTSYCIMNEGIGKVLRFGAFSEDVINRLKWMQDSLGPILSKALKKRPGGMNLNVLIAKAITMGDEFHQRNIAGSAIFMKEITPLIMKLDVPDEEKYRVVSFLADTDQFFLNIMMAASKSIMDCARKITEGTVVTIMSRNGRDFGVKISGMGDEWFKAPVNTPNGLYFTGYSAEDANPDIGDSAITETVGVGGMAMIAAPGVTRFVGAGGFQDALNVSNEMNEICISNNPAWTIPTWDFKGTCLGIDARKVVASGITPLINTGIAHRQAGVGQIGAGTVRAPLACFEQALLAYAKKLGIDLG